MLALNRSFILLLAVAAILCIPGPANAAMLTYETLPAQEVNSLPVLGRATVTTSTDEIRILLENLTGDPTSVAQNISGVILQGDWSSSTASLESAVSSLRTLWLESGATVWQDSEPQELNKWKLEPTDTQQELTIFGSGQPRQSIIGPPNQAGIYTNANTSLRNTSHNPFAAQSAVFVIHIDGVTAETRIKSLNFCFNTVRTEVPAILVPEPASLCIVGAGLAYLTLRRRLVS